MFLSNATEKPLIISAAITGSIVTRNDHPDLPVTPTEIAESSIACVEAGASIVDLHVREPDGTPSPRVDLYEEAIDHIRKRVDCLINVSTGSGGGRFSEEQRLAPVALSPDIATFDCGSMNFGERIFENSPAFLRKLASTMQSYDVLPEIECFDLGMVENALRLGREGHLPVRGKWWFQLCFGVPGGAPLRPSVLAAMLELLPLESEWSILGIGRAQLPATLIGLALGGHIRTGFEDNVYLRKGVLASSNRQLVERVVTMAGELGRPVATADDARVLLGL